MLTTDLRIRPRRRLGGGVEHGRLGDQAIGQVGSQDGPARFGVRPVQAEHDRGGDLDTVEGLQHAVGHLVDPGDPTEDVDEDGAHSRVRIDDLEGGGHHVGVGAATDV
jgi:hypothetical protein